MKKIIAVAVAGAVLGSAGASASVSDAEFAELRAQFADMARRLSDLEAENQQLRQQGSAGIAVTTEDLAATNAEIASLQAQAKRSSWTENVKWTGDFRYRHENIEEEGRDDRDRDRVRARAHLEAKTGQDSKVGLGLATGGDDPVSTNQTLGGGGSTKDIRLDLAYFTWTGLENTYLTAGKFKNPFYAPQKSGLIWDGDFRPEGAVIGWADDMFFATASYSYLESDSNRGDDAYWVVELGGKFMLGDGVQLTAAAQYLDFPTKGRGPLYDGSFFGNSAVNDEYLYDYQVVNGSLDLGFSLLEMPMSVYVDYAYNNDADDYDTGYLAGVKLGKASKKGSWQLLYQYEKLEADATLGLVADSDFAGGGTDGKGSKFAAKYMIDDAWYVSATYFDTTRGFDLGGSSDYKRLQVDTGFKY